MLEEIVKLINNEKINTYAVCVIENGKEEYAEIKHTDNCHNCYSVAKAFTVTAAGLLFDDGLLDVDELVYPVLKDEFPAGYDKKWERVKLSDVMRHRAGFGRAGLLDIDVEDVAAYGTKNYLKYVLSQPLAYEPGETWVYTDAAFYLVSRFLSKKCGRRIDDLLLERIMSPMDYTEVAFSKCPYGYPMGGTGLYITTRDMAKLGLLYLNGGVYNGKRLLSEKFVNTVLSRGFELCGVGVDGAYAKGGYQGQMLYFNTKTNRVIAYHSTDAEAGKIFDLIRRNGY